VARPDLDFWASSGYGAELNGDATGEVTAKPVCDYLVIAFLKIGMAMLRVTME
jgi:hypothetical protein